MLSKPTMSPKSQNKTKPPLSSFSLILLVVCSIGASLFILNKSKTKGIRAFSTAESNKNKATQKNTKQSTKTSAQNASTKKRTAPHPSNATQTTPEKPKYTLELIARNLSGPSGIITLPSGIILVSEEYAARITTLHSDGSRAICADRKTPLFRIQPDGTRIQDKPLISPEGLALDATNRLYVVEDLPGGRLLRFTLNNDGIAQEGEVIPIPGQWSRVAWEGIAVANDGRILLAGSNAESLYQKDKTDLFSGYIIYRDAHKNWWVPYDRIFASFSSVAFSKDNLNAIYTCEFSGELSWIDLTENKRAGGFCSRTLKQPEGIAVLPDGTLIIAEEPGSLILYDPALDTTYTLPQKFSATEAVTWDATRKRILVADDEDGVIYALTASTPIQPDTDRMQFARYEALISRLNIPEKCPQYLQGVLDLAGLNYSKPNEQTLPFQQLTQRIPMVAADAKAIPIKGQNNAKDPIEHIQFVVFEPNTITMTPDGLITSLAGFYARTRSGKTITSSTKKMSTRSISPQSAKLFQHGTSSLVAPHASSITVTPTGSASVQFAGLGITPDFTLIINPIVIADSYMVVFHPDGTRDQYQLTLPPHAPSPENWVVAYADQLDISWKPLQVNLQ